jgi:PRTRC genetic system protein B
MKHSTRPWQRKRVLRPQPDVIIANDHPPLAQITIYSDLTLLTRRDASGLWRQYPVSADAVAEALSNLPRGSGLLPPNTLATGSVHGQPYAVAWLPPMRATLRTPAYDYTTPLPPLVWAGCGDQYRVFALGHEGVQFPTDGTQPLYCAPMPNTYANGAICWGDSERRPRASLATLMQAWDIFATSYFNSHVQNGKSQAYPGSILTLWALLAERVDESYPLDDLVPATNGTTLNWLVNGSPWAQGGAS